jgi:hypothetical protein
MRIPRPVFPVNHRGLIPTALVLSLSLLLSLSSAGQTDKKKEPPLKTVHGQVLDKNANPLPRAIVFLNNKRTNVLKTSIAEDDGGYRFSGLDPNTDYEIHAEDKGAVSATHTLSSFDNRKDISLNLKIVRK